MSQVIYSNQYLLLVKDLVGWLVSLGVEEYSSKYCRKDYTQHQHIVLLVLRAHEGKAYRDFVEWLGVCDCLVDFLDLARIPHYTTLQKAASRLRPGFLEELMGYIGGLVAKEGCVVGIDSTGFSLDYSSRHYCLRIKRADKHKNYLKLSMAADMNSQVILSTRMRLQRRHDSIDLETVLQRAKDVVDMSAVVADKGYDSEENLSFIEEKLHARAVISLKNIDKPLKKTKGKRRRKLKRRFPKRLYRQRSKAETVFSVVKREYGETILSRTQRTKKNECYFKLIAYNTKKAINKLETLTVIEGFYRANSFRETSGGLFHLAGTSPALLNDPFYSPQGCFKEKRTRLHNFLSPGTGGIDTFFLQCWSFQINKEKISMNRS